MSEIQAFKLGQFIEINCRYCRLNLDAVVASLNADGSPAKVQCRTCMHFQDFKPPADLEEKHRKLVEKAMKIAQKHTRGPAAAEAKARKDAATAKAQAGDLRPEAVMRRLWEEATADVSPMKMKVYDKHRSYHKDDVITHKTYGLGVVVRDDVEFSMTVLFRDQVVELDCDQPRED